jgi:hypothetical protein
MGQLSAELGVLLPGLGKPGMTSKTGMESAKSTVWNLSLPLRYDLGYQAR